MEWAVVYLSVLGLWMLLSIFRELVMAKKRKKLKLVTLPSDHPSQDQSGRFEIDQVFRRHGFSIHKRIDHLVLWKRDGEIYHELEVLEMVDEYALADAEYAEYLYEESLAKGATFEE